jgi:DNA repair protein RadC
MFDAEMMRNADVSTFTAEQFKALFEVAEKAGLYQISQLNYIKAVDDYERYLSAAYGSMEREIFGVSFLDNQHGVIATEVLFSGTIDGASIYPREVVKAALKHNASAVIFFHNHPSGLLEPSEADKRITDRLKTALETVEIRTLDHFIVTKVGAMSFAKAGLL